MRLSGVLKLSTILEYENHNLNRQLISEFPPNDIVGPRFNSTTALEPLTISQKVFQRVVDSIPTYGSHPENRGLKLSTKVSKVKIVGCSRVVVCRAEYRYSIGPVLEPNLGVRRVVDTFVGANEGYEESWWV
uniref:Uncharacterized protein n=1 Tax=Ananas comosus var. bracteatus TaxID=296719 RepID=A0A6V7QCR1_ANACO|nr:unnamed protein product [Ananas comosus var. bracteatus]